MNTILNEAIEVTVVKKSKFIAILKRVDSQKEALKVIDECKMKYIGAKHYVYVYIIDGIIKCSDDKEPSKTAASPILNVLLMNNLNHVICVVIRYFGGILLGANGLVRAYLKSTTNALLKTSIIPLVLYCKVSCIFTYENIKNINFLLKDINILDKKFEEMITYTFLIPENSPLLDEIKKYAEMKKE